MIRVRTTPARLDTATFRVSHWFVLSRILLLIRLGLRIVHCQWAIQSTDTEDTTHTDDTDELQVIHNNLLGKLKRFTEHFDGNDKTEVLDMIASMLGELRSMRATDCSQEWKDLKAFAWNTRFPGRVLLPSVAVLKWRNKIVKLKRAFMKVLQLSQDGDTAGSYIIDMIRGFNEFTLTLNGVALVDDAFNGIAAVAGDAPIEIAAVADDTLNVVEDGTDDTLNEVPSDHTHPLHVPADDQDDASEMSSH
jgi:hypothetical protein